MITLQINAGNLPQRLSLLASQVARPRAMLAAAAGGLLNLLVDHFLERDAEGNARGFPRTHFWANEGAQKTSIGRIQDQYAIVQVASRLIAHKLTGGPILPVNGKALAIPQTPEAADRAPSTFEAVTGVRLILIKVGGKNGNSFSNAVLAASLDGNPKHLTVEYVLVPGVIQPADPRTLPPPEAQAAAAAAAAQDYVDSINGPAGQGGTP